MTDPNQPPQNPYPQGGPAQATGPQGYQQPTAGAPSAELSPADQRMWAMLAHLGGILFGFLAPLVVWLVQKDRGLFVADQSKEALNFQITMAIAMVVGIVTSIIGIGFLLIFAVWIAVVVFSIIAGLAANKGENYRYPLTLRLVS